MRIRSWQRMCYISCIRPVLTRRYSLNTRKTLRDSRFKASANGDHILPVIFPKYSINGSRRAPGEYSVSLTNVIISVRSDDNSRCSVGKKRRNTKAWMQRWALFYILDSDALNNVLPQLEINVQRTFDTRLDDIDQAMPAIVRIATPDFKTWGLLRLCTSSGNVFITVLTIHGVASFTHRTQHS
jgi:hypothetical protein